MNKVRLQLELEKNIETYCLSCRSCASNYNDPNTTTKSKAARLVNNTKERTPEELRDSFSRCVKLKETV